MVGNHGESWFVISRLLVFFHEYQLPQEGDKTRFMCVCSIFECWFGITFEVCMGVCLPLGVCSLGAQEVSHLLLLAESLMQGQPPSKEISFVFFFFFKSRYYFKSSKK